MRKHDDGYALSYVLVVLLVLCAIALAITSISLNNLKRQQASIDRMEEKYVAQGLVEQVVAQLESATIIKDDIIEAIKTQVAATDGIDPERLSQEILVANNIISIHIKYNETTVKAELTLTEITEQPEGSDSPVTTGYKVTYNTYSTEVTS